MTRMRSARNLHALGRMPGHAGVPTGPINGIWVLDTESFAGHGVDGLAERAKLEAKYGKLPVTLQVRTASGGMHEYWRWPSDGNVINIIRTSTSKLAPGIDVMGLNYMVVAPPTVDPKWPDPYSCLNEAPIIEAPDWLVKLAVEAAGRGDDSDGSARASGKDEPIPDFLADIHADFVATLMALIPEQ